MLEAPGIEDSQEWGDLRDWQNLASGHIAFAEGRYQEALDYLAEDFYLYLTVRYAQQLLLNTRARAHLALNQVDQAIAALEFARPHKMGVIQQGGTVWFWQRNLYDLAELYDTIGEIRKANEVRAELTAMLALADADHPFL